MHTQSKMSMPFIFIATCVVDPRGVPVLLLLLLLPQFDDLAKDFHSSPSLLLESHKMVTKIRLSYCLKFLEYCFFIRLLLTVMLRLRSRGLQCVAQAAGLVLSPTGSGSVLLIQATLSQLVLEGSKCFGR